MNNLQLNDRAMEILASIKGKKLKSFEGDMISMGNYFMNPIKLNMPRFSVELGLSYVPLEWTSSFKTNEVEDATVFYCEMVDPSKKAFGNAVCLFPVEETISSVTVIRDYIGTNMGDSFVFDNGILLSAGNESLSFFRFSVWDCAMYLRNKDDAMSFYSAKRARDDFADIIDKKMKINLKREFMIL